MTSPTPKAPEKQWLSDMLTVHGVNVKMAVLAVIGERGVCHWIDVVNWLAPRYPKTAVSAMLNELLNKRLIQTYQGLEPPCGVLLTPLGKEALLEGHDLGGGQALKGCERWKAVTAAVVGIGIRLVLVRWFGW